MHLCNDLISVLVALLRISSLPLDPLLKRDSLLRTISISIRSAQTRTPRTLSQIIILMRLINFILHLMAVDLRGDMLIAVVIDHRFALGLFYLHILLVQASPWFPLAELWQSVLLDLLSDSEVSKSEILLVFFIYE